ncbi:MAG: riboflavin biosynthesis protein RibD [Phycisphaeraceae bacterium]|nr:riboflavin biosynthesis protein RibD [Phycisphaeraceae bacterium]
MALTVATTDPNPSDDRALMGRAIRLARRGRGRVEPNPVVGCVIARAGQVIGEGHHRRFGGPHAEIEALRDCRKRGTEPAGADVYVTLEPCAHHGKTPPCADALVEAGVGTVHAAIEDPNPQVAGRGLERLRAAGIDVDLGTCADEATELVEAYLKRVRTGLPWVILKWAQTLDGAIATADGDSRWISGAASRRRVHRLRAQVDAIMVGIGTVLGDDPLLTARDVPVHRIARRVVVDPNARLPAECRLLTTLDAAHPVTVAVRAELLDDDDPRVRALAERGVEIVGLPKRGQTPFSSDGAMDLRPLMEHLSAVRSATRVLVEGGSRLAGALFAQNLVDQVQAYVAPKVLAATGALPAASGLARTRIEHADRLVLNSMRRIGDDVLLDYRVEGGGGGREIDY